MEPLPGKYPWRRKGALLHLFDHFANQHEVVRRRLLAPMSHGCFWGMWCSSPWQGVSTCSACMNWLTMTQSTSSNGSSISRDIQCCKQSHVRKIFRVCCRTSRRVGTVIVGIPGRSALCPPNSVQLASFGVSNGRGPQPLWRAHAVSHPLPYRIGVGPVCMPVHMHTKSMLGRPGERSNLGKMGLIPLQLAHFPSVV